MQITGPKSLKLEELACTLFKTRTRQPGERLYLSIKEKGIKDVRNPLLDRVSDKFWKNVIPKMLVISLNNS